MPDVTARILPEPPRDARFDPACRRCPRLAAFLDEVREAHPTYWCRPVPPFGDAAARLLVVIRLKLAQMKRHNVTSRHGILRVSVLQKS